MSDTESSTALPVRPELDPIDVLAALGVRHPGSIAPVRGGSDAQIWRVEYESTSFALRVLRPEQQLVAQREVAALAAAQQAGLPVPRLHTHGSWNGYPALLLGWCPGRTLASVLGKQPWRIRALGLAFGRAQASIHRIAAPPGLDESWIAWAGDDPSLAQRLRQAQSAPPAMLHGDYHPLNVLAGGDGISCILDWANARAGDPRADLARTWTILRIEPLGPHASPALEAVRRILAWYWRRGYREVAGRIDDNPLFRAWAGAVMQRDLARRIEKPGSWWRQEHLDRLKRWTDRQRRAAGVG